MNMNKLIVFLNAADAHVSHSTDAPVIAVEYMERGYYPIYTHATAEVLNLNKNVTPDILEAALMGSMFGWTVPAARPAVDYFKAREQAALA
jgi:hypothetical protein